MLRHQAAALPRTACVSPAMLKRDAYRIAIKAALRAEAAAHWPLRGGPQDDWQRTNPRLEPDNLQVNMQLVAKVRCPPGARVVWLGLSARMHLRSCAASGAGLHATCSLQSQHSVTCTVAACCVQLTQL